MVPAKIARSEKRRSEWPHRFALLLVVTVFPLIWMGGLVTTTAAGMAVPDWPGTYSHNMFTFPWYDWFFGPWDLFVEHGHRLLGSLSGIISIALVVVTWRFESRRWVRWFSVWLLLLIIVQGVLGGLRVLMDERSLAMVHGCVGPAFFAVAIAFCVVTSRWWMLDGSSSAVPANRGYGLWRAALVLLVVVYSQLVLGAAMRHMPVDARPGSFLHHVYTHIATAVLILLGTGWHTWRVWRWTHWRDGLRGSMVLLVGFIALQIGLGLATWVFKYGFPAWLDGWLWGSSFVIPHRTFWQTTIITGHSALGSLILATWTVQMMRCGRISHGTAATVCR